MIKLQYLGKKSGFTLSLPFLSQKYVVEGPGTTVDMTDQDATNMMAVNPRMFRIVGVSREGLTPSGGNLSVEKPFAPPAQAAAPPTVNVSDGTGSPAPASPEDPQTPEQAAMEMLKDEEGPKDQLGGDGVEGTDPLPPASGDPAAPPAADSNPAVEPVTMGALMGFKEPQLRAYAKDLYGHEFGPEDKRMGMIKKIKELEQARQLAAG
jgi:hypothetical protein